MICRWLFVLLAIVLIILPASARELASRWNGNIAALIIMHNLVAGDPAGLHGAERALSSFDDVCRRSWLLSLIYDSLGDLEHRDKAWETSLRCCRAYIQLVRAMAHDNINLAELAVQIYPDQADAWFWLAESKLENSPEQAVNAHWQGLQLRPHDTKGWMQLGKAMTYLDPQVAWSIYDRIERDPLVAKDSVLQNELRFILAALLSKSQPERAIQLYRDALQHKPHDGIRWYELGDLLAQTDPQAAIEAYLQSCHRGDPGNHGCYGAGRVAEQEGDIQRAIQYYRMSDWEGALQRADELERALR